MSLNFELPGWLEACRPDDGLYADAYEGTPAELRALLKTAIAFYFHRWPHRDGMHREEYASVRSGFRHDENSAPADWVLAVLGESFASPARLLAVLVPAILAGVGRIVIVSEAPFAPAIVAAMELAGLEDSFVLDSDHLPGLYEDLRTIAPDGRIVAFPDADGSFSNAQKEVLHAAALDGMLRLRDLPAPRILSLHTSDSEAASRLRWLHPDAEFLNAEDVPQFPAFSGIRGAFLPDYINAPSGLPFCAGPGMEACWPGPSPEFYRTRSCSAFLFQENMETLS